MHLLVMLTVCLAPSFLHHPLELLVDIKISGERLSEY